MLHGDFVDGLGFYDISVISGVRYRGRTVDHSKSGRGQHGLLYVFSGEATFFCQGKKSITAQGGSLIYIPKFKKYKLTFTGESTAFVVVNFHLNKDSKEVLLFNDVALIMKEEHPSVLEIMTAFERLGASREIGAVLEKKRLTYQLLGTLYSLKKLSFLNDGDASLIDEGVLMLEATYMENLPIEAFAAAAHVSVNTFRRQFQKKLGTSPVKYRNYLRIQRAKELLCEGGFTVNEVAYQSGFENIGYFCRCYRQLTGEAPSETRKKYTV